MKGKCFNHHNRVKVEASYKFNSNSNPLLNTPSTLTMTADLMLLPLLTISVASLIKPSFAVFVSIDCGGSNSSLDANSIEWTRDANYVTNGVSQVVDSFYSAGTVMGTLKSIPNPEEKLQHHQQFAQWGTSSPAGKLLLWKLRWKTLCSHVRSSVRWQPVGEGESVDIFRRYDPL